MNTEHNRDHLDLIVGVITVVYVGGIHIVIESNQVIRVMLLITMLFKYVLRSHSIRCSVISEVYHDANCHTFFTQTMLGL